MPLLLGVVRRVWWWGEVIVLWWVSSTFFCLLYWIEMLSVQLLLPVQIFGAVASRARALTY